MRHSSTERAVAPAAETDRLRKENASLLERLADMDRFHADGQRVADEREAQIERARLDLAAGERQRAELEEQRARLERQVGDLHLAAQARAQADRDERDRLEAAIVRHRHESAELALFAYMLRGDTSQTGLFRRLTSGGTAAMARGEHPRGEVLLRLAALLRPLDRRAWRRYAASLEVVGEHAAAEVAWRRAVGLDRNDAAALYGLARTLAETGRHEEAGAALETAFAIDPGLPGLGTRLDAAGIEPGRQADIVLASSWLRGSVRRRPARGLMPSGIRDFLALRRARRAAERGDPRRAMRLHGELADRSDDPVELVRHGDAIAALTGPVAARGAYLKAFAAQPDDGRSRRRALDVRHGDMGLVARPKVDLKVDADGNYVTMSDDAQIDLDPDGRAFPAGWTLVSISATAPAAPIRPVVYAFHGEHGATVKPFTFPLIEGEGEVRCLLPLPAGIVQLRLDPTGHAGVTFRLNRVGWLGGAGPGGGGLEGQLFVPAARGVAFVGEEPAADDGTDPTTRSFALRPLQDLAILADGAFVSTDEDPQFDVVGAGGVLGGWTWIDLQVEGVDTPLDPVLYAWTEDEVVAIRLPDIAARSGAIRVLVRLPDQVSRLRFDPAARAGVRFGAVTFQAAPMPADDRVFLPCPADPIGDPGAMQARRDPDAAHRVRPLDQLEAVGDRFRTTGDAPRFAVEPAGPDAAGFPEGVVRLTLGVDEADQAVDAALYALDDAGHALCAYRFGSLEPGVSCEHHLVLPAGVRSLRFAPGDTRNVTLSLPRVELLPLGAADEASYAVARRQDMPPDAGPDAVSTGLQPLQHLEERDGMFRSTGNDPQFHVAMGGRAFPRGWTVVTVEMDVVDTIARPILYLWSGAGVTPIQLASLSGKGCSQQLVHLPDDVSEMRLDPTDMAGIAFSAPRLAFSPASLFAGRLLSRLPNAGRRVDYETWCDLYDRIGRVDRVLIGEAIGRLTDTPLISVLMPVYDPDPRFLRRALDTVIDQIYPNWELCIAEDCSPSEETRAILREYAARDDRIKVVFRTRNGHISRASNSALELVTGAFVALMDHDDELPPHALYLIATELDRFPDTDVIYTDEDKIDQHGRRHDPYFKNDWNQELFYSQNCVAHLGVYRTALVRAVGGFRAGFDGSQDYDLMLRILRLTSSERIRHIPHVLYHWRIFEGVRTFSSNNPSNSVNTARQAMVEYFADAEPDSEVEAIPYFPGWWRIRRPLPTTPPSVTIIIPTRDRVELVRNCVEGLLERTDYPHLDVVIVDNGSIKAESLDYFETIARHPRVGVLRDDGPFNYSRLNNLAVAQAAGDLVCFLNNDIETISPDWLSEMVSQVLRPGVGAVGTRLLYASGTLQHAGITMGVYGVAAHGHRHFPGDSIGYFGHPQLVREVSAVTAAALLMPKGLFQAIGGFDEDNLAVSYNDVDLCLRVREAGRKVVYTPFAALYHLESASRGLDVTVEQREAQRVERGYMEARWESAIEEDPFYSRNLTIATEDCDLAFPPRARRPWLEEADVAERLARLGRAALPEPEGEALAALAA
ncbi:glycosyltransferase, partial [Sphingomonas bacterium]|uniref:glycosyltransferase n=1 Tax=Sphingomonas bacterium TaxID=1895847 RepID=UPI001576C7CE